MFMNKTKKAALAVIMASLILIVALPEYGLAAFSTSNTNQEPQWTLTNTPTLGLSANPTRFYVLVDETVTSRITISKFTGIVDLEVLEQSGIISKIEPKMLNLNNQVGYATLTIKAQPKIDVRSVNITVKASSGLTIKKIDINVTILQPNFRISASTIYVEPGKQGTGTITLTSVDRFNGTVSLTTSTIAGWETPTLGNNAPAIAYPSRCSTTLTVTAPSSAKSGRYIVTVTGEYRNHGESDEIVHSVNMTVMVIRPDFRLSTNPSTTYLLKGSIQTWTIRVSPIDRFNGSVTLSVSEIVHPDSGTLTPILGSSAVAIQYNQAGSTTLSITVPSNPEYGKYVLQVTGKSSYLGQTLEHSFNVTVYVINPDFAIYSSASLLSIPAGKSANLTIRALSIGRLNDTIALTAQSAPNGWTTKIYTDQLKIAYNQTSSTTITIAVPAGTESGKYTIDLKGLGISSSLTDTTSVKIIVP